MNYISNRIPNSFHIFSTYKHQNFFPEKITVLLFCYKKIIFHYIFYQNSSFSNYQPPFFVIKKEQTNKSYSLYTYYLTFFFQIPIIRAETTAPINIEKIYNTGLFTKAITNNPPCGAGNVIWNNIDNAPAILEPTTQLTITRTGSAAANGIAPSVINDAPHNIIC